MPDDYIVRNCAPTLAGLKTGSMFAYPYDSKESVLRWIRDTNCRFRSKGLRLLPLRFSGRKALIYLYRPKRLSADFAHADVIHLLEQCGYHADSCEKCIVRLMHKLRTQKHFPHEIGLFLGYPPEDVKGFMENNACNCKCVGCWKVYGDEESARKRFAQYKKCTEVYCRQWAKRKDMERLAVAFSCK